MASTVKVDKIEGSTGSTVEVTSGQTFKATAPIIATSILDTSSNELFKLTATGSATNELTVANAATGSGPTISSTGSSDSNIDINITPAGTGDVVLAADTVKVGDSGAAATLTSNGAMPITKVTLTDNRILAAPTNSQTGQFVSLLIIQDATGSRTLTWNAVFEFPLEAAPTLTTTGGLADLFVFRYHNSKWLQVGATLALTVA
jgi:hypothetical protein